MQSRRWVVHRFLPMLGIAPWLSAQKKENAVKDKRDVRLSNPAMLAKPNGYSHVAEVMSGRTVYIAGQVSLDKAGQLVGKDDFRAQVEQVFANVNEAVKAAGGSMHDVIKLNYYCADRVDRSLIAAVREIRDRYVNTQSPPVSTFVFISSLVRPEWMIEVEAVAVVD